MTMNKSSSVPTRFTTEKIRLTYAFLWEPRSTSDNDGDPDDKSKKYSTSILIPKGDQVTLNRFNAAIQYAIAVGQKKGLWGDKLPSNFKLPLRDGDAESVEKGEEYEGHWFLNASSTRMPRLVDLGRNDILDPSELYSGCYARVCLNLFPFSAKGNRGIGCGLEAVQKICDGEPLGGVPVDLDEAFGGWDNEGAPMTNPAYGYEQPGNVPMGSYPAQQAPGNPVQQQAPAGYPMQQQASQGYQVQQASVGYAPTGVPVYPVQQAPSYATQQQPAQGFASAPTSFANSVAAADSILPPQMFGEAVNGRVA